MSPPPLEETLRRRSHPFLFPEAQSTVLPDPSRFFSPHLLSSPLPTNSFFQNFVLKNGDQPEYIHPYIIKSSMSSLSLCYPSQFSNSAFIYQIFNRDLTISASNNTDPNSTHIVSSFSDLSLTLDFPSSNLKFFLVRGNPYLTCIATSNVRISISTIHAILQFSSNSSLTKYTISLNNNQQWLLYTSSPIQLSHDISSINSGEFSGIIRIALLPDSNPKYEAILDRFSSCYPVSGDAVFTKPYCLEYKWEKKGWGDLLILAHPLHLRLLSGDDSEITVLEDLKYKSIDGELVGVVGDSWVLKSDPVSVTWHSIRGVKEESYPEIIYALSKDVEALNPATISTTSSYFYGKLIARAARLAVIAEELNYIDVIPVIWKFLKDTIEPWLDGTFGANAMEIHSAQTWWHVREGDTLYAQDFTRENRVVGVLWANKRDSGLWFAPPQWRECRLGIQLLPLLPISEVLFSEIGFVRDLVAWTLPALAREGVEEGWKGFLYALEGIYNKEGALSKIRSLNGYDDGNSLTNLLWWIHSRDNEGEGCEGEVEVMLVWSLLLLE
ncbi:glycosyl hydrolase family 81 protein [Actinidia rufa]|uniref:glucan endo-1,3-beta-D-glucosidase n=1 Tax=Actinidia rufa TaxID=165716 RepID=A0A7J0H887_9ERIC|nr:glycosyl hydrolase family 81 protein [Actinidia rufa]